MTVKHMLGSRKGNVRTVSIADTLNDACRVMADAGIGSVLILDDNSELAGILTERDIVRQLGDGGADALQRSVASVMSLKPTTCSITDDAYDAIEKMMDRQCRHLPVMEAGSVVGVVSARDVMENIWAKASERDRKQLIA